MPLRNSVALVTGAGGFVGANLVRRLVADGATVHAIVRPTTDPWRLIDLGSRITSHPIELTDRDSVRRIVHAVRPDVVFHLAKHRGTPSTLDYRAAYDTNLLATLHLLDAVRDLSLRRFVHAGSSLEYDLRRSPLRESDALAPRTVHGVTKAAASLLCQQFATTHSVPAIVLRLFTVFGPWEGPSRFVPRLMLAALGGPPLALTPDSLVHDWIFVDDVVDACVRAVSADGLDGEVVNVATGRESTNEAVVLAVEALGVRVARSAEAFPARTWDTGHWVADVSKARDRLDWQAEITLESGLARTLEWFRRHGHLYTDRPAG